MKKLISFSMRAALLCACMLTLLSNHLLAQLPAFVPANGLVAWYPFNGNANDESGNGNNGVVNGALPFVEDRNSESSKAIQGGNGYITVSSGFFNFGYNQIFSISVWFTQSSGSSGRIISTENPEGQFRISTYGNGLNAIQFGNSFNYIYDTIADLNWHNYTFVYNGAGIGRKYVDGQFEGDFPINFQENLSYGFPFTIGAKAAPAYDKWNGKMDDIGIWNRALSAEEITALYTSQAEPTCNLGTISTPAATICAGESISLVAEPAATASGCFTPNVKQAGNQNFGITSTHRDAEGNYYVSGAYNGATTIEGISVPSIGNRDIFLAKYNSCGQIQWVTRGGSSGDQDYAGDGSHGIATDAAGNVYIVGRYNQAFTFYGANATTFSAPWTSTSNGNHQDGFLVKLNSSGQVVWGASLRGTSNDGFVGVAVDGVGNPVVTGGFNGCCPSSFAVTIFGPNGSVGVNSFGSNYGSGLVAKFDTNGNILWKAAVYNRDTGLGSLAIDAANNIYLTASFRSWSNGTAAQFIDASGANNSLFNPGIGLAYLVKLNASGNWQWGTTFGNVGDGVGSLTAGADVAVDASGNPWVVGYFRGAQATVYSTNGSNLTIPASTNDIGFLISYSASGAAQSVVTRQQSTGSTYYRSLAIASDKIAIAGYYTGTNAGLNDILLANYTAAGAFIDAQVAGGAGDDYGLSIIPSGSSFAVCGSTAGGFALDGVNITGPCTYLWNLAAGQGQASVSWSTGANTPAISVAPMETTTYTATFSDGTNTCSQEVTVTVNQPSATTIESTITEGETYDFNGQSLTAAGTYEEVFVNAAGCDSSVTLTLSVAAVPLNCGIEASMNSICLGDSASLTAFDSGFLPCSGATQSSYQWELLIPASAYNNNEINFDPACFDKEHSKLYSALKTGSINRVYCFDFNTNQVSTIPSSGGPGELYEAVYDFSNQRILANRVGRDAVFALPLTGGTWTQEGSGGFDAESYGANTFWNPISQRFSYFGGYGFFAVKNWVWENNGSGWINTYVNNSNCNPGKRIGQISLNGTGDKVYIFSGQGSCAGNQTASSCTLGSPWATDVGVYCWLRDIWQLDLQTYQFTNVLPVNSQSISREGAFVYDYEHDDFYIVGGFVPSGNYSTNVNNNGNTWSNELLRYRVGEDTGFSAVSAAGDVPPVSNSNIGNGTAYYDANYDRIILARKDGIWALNLSTCEKTYAWSTGETTPTLTVAPTETTTYSVTVRQGDQTCTSDVTITVNQPSATTIEATITEGETFDFNGQSITASGTYEAVLLTAEGCDSTVTLTLSVEAAFDCGITASDLQVCEGASVTLTSAAAGGIPSVNYSLDFPNTAQYSGSAQAVGSTNKDGFNLTGDFTIEFWIKAEGSFYWHLMGKNTFGNNSQGWLLKKPGANLGIGWTYVPNEFDFHSFNFGNWEHVAICFDDASNTFRYFKNGILTTTQARDININASPYDLVIGHELGTGNWFDGKLDNLRISNVSRYSGNFNPTQTFLNDANTVAMYDFNEGSGNVAQDISGNGRVLNLFNTNYSADVPSGSDINQSALTWSTGAQEQSITVTPESTSTYFVTYDDGTTVCQDSITITVLPNETYYADADGDGFGNFEMPLTTCDVVIPEGYTLDNTDCNDGDALNYPFASCDDGDPCTIEDVIQLDCTCAGFFADSDEDGTCDANDLCQGGLEPGTPCDDGEPCTVNDVIQSDCFCFGTVVDEDNDGVCDIYDTCPGAEAGTACDDNDPCTVNDIVLADCTCAGTFADADNDGTCDANDLCFGSETGTACDDNDPCTVNDIIQSDCSCAGSFADADNDGTCDANDLCEGSEAGTACDDNDPCTVNDVIQSDCSCAGTFADADNDGTCDANDLCDGSEAGTACDDNDPCTINDVIQTDCTCAGTFADADGDGTCDANDLCEGPEAGTACDDSDPCTVNDVIREDCSCAGEFADSDADGTCDAFDLCKGPEAGTACDDSDPCTVNDIVNESCTCVGEPVAVGTSVTTITACDSYNWNETTYNASGVFTYETTNAAGCDSIATLELTIRQSSQAPQAAMASLNTTSPGQSVTLTVNGGSLGTNAQWVWYSGSCGGTPVGQGSSISVNPAATTTYYVRAQGSCNTTACAQVTINVQNQPCGPQTVTASSTAICAGNAVTLSVTGTLTSGAVWKWYKNGCGLGTSVGTGATIAVIPTATTMYFVRAEGGSCGLTTCLSVSVSVSAVPAKPTVITGPAAALCSQQGVVYSTPQLAGVISYMWTVPSGATIVSGQGTSSITVNFSSSIGPNSTCGYTGICVSALNGCGASMHHCMQVSLTPAAPAGIVASTSVCRFQEATFAVLNPIAGMTYTWEVPNNWQILSGQGTASITAMVGLNDGQVRVYATNACGMSKKFSRFVGPINCNRSEITLELNLWPNPASERVFFAHGDAMPDHLHIFDMLGRDIYSGTWLPEFDVSGLSSGIYFVRATSGGESVVKRMEVAR